ncbi:hypothetical protein EV183_005514 [Coemansia sp. RSA 2336]|nr:hypothetical protein EV183_005514 [Coemansia sp. RSA 2336]
MLPENASVAIEPVRACRLLRKLLDKVAELEDTAAPDDPKAAAIPRRQNRTFSRPTTPRTKRVSHMIPPPAHPFNHLLVKQTRRQPRYTYKRRRCPASESDNESPPILRSPSLESLSDSEACMDPALWLTTPRKRQRRGSSTSIRSMDSDGSMETRSRSFTSRLETLVVPAHSSATSRFKSMHLLSYLVSLGETLWLGGVSEDPVRQMRLLPLKVISAFRLGEAIACSDGSDDLEYVNEMYCSLPPFLVRFVLWQHAVSLCYLRIPAYFDTLSEALWQVAPLHLRAVDIGTESLLVRDMLKRINTHTESDSNAALWLQFIPTKALNLPNDSSETANTRRYAKWVARISNVAESIRILSTALKQTLSVARSSSVSNSQYPRTSTMPNASLEMDLMEAIQSICAIIFTKLCYVCTISDNDHFTLVSCLCDCLMAFSKVTKIALHMAKSTDAVPETQSELSTLCLTQQIILALLTICQFRRFHTTVAGNVADKERVIDMAKLLIRWMCEKGQQDSVQTSKRSSLVARFNAVFEEASNVDSEGIFERIVLPLATVGASPTVLCEIADIVANDLQQHKTAQTIIELALQRFSNIWDRHLECKVWHQEWSQLQSTTMPGDSEHEDSQSIYSQLQLKLAQLKPATKKHSIKSQNSEVPEDELGLLLPRRRISRIHSAK